MQAGPLQPPVLESVMDGIGAAPLERFQAGRKWGLRDAAGSVVVAPAYDGMRRYSEGRIWVNAGGRSPWDGAEYERQGWSHHQGEASGGRWGLLDERGQVVLEPTYEWGRPF